MSGRDGFRSGMAEGAEEDEVPEDEASRESFPASDPPSTWAGERFAAPDRLEEGGG